MKEKLDLFDPAGGYALWHRATRRHKWRVVGTAETHLGAVALMSGSGEYLVTESGTGPDGASGNGSFPAQAAEPPTREQSRSHTE